MDGNSKDAENKQKQILSWLNYIYDAAVNVSIPGIGPSVEELAESYLKDTTYKTMEERANSLVNYQVVKTSATGFITGLGGIITMPIAVPADLSVVTIVQLKMIAAIAYMGGYNPKDDQVRTMVYVILLKMDISDILKRTGIRFVVKMGETSLKKIPGKIFIEINKKIGFKLLTKFGQKGIVNLVEVVPILGGLVGGGIDGGATKIIGNKAIKNFIKV